MFQYYIKIRNNSSEMWHTTGVYNKWHQPSAVSVSVSVSVRRKPAMSYVPIQTLITRQLRPCPAQIGTHV